MDRRDRKEVKNGEVRRSGEEREEEYDVSEEKGEGAENKSGKWSLTSVCLSPRHS